MKATLPFLHRAFGAGLIALVLVFVCFMTYLYLTFFDLMVGKVELKAEPSLIGKLDTAKFDWAVKQLAKREALAPPDPKLPDPFNTTGSASLPANPQAPPAAPKQ